MLDYESTDITIARQCDLLGIARSTAYYEPLSRDNNDELIKRRMDEVYTEHPFYGYRRLAVILRNEGYQINGKKVRRLMREMGIQAIYPKPKTSIPDTQHRKYPYLLKDVEINRVNQVWSMDITYIPMRKGFLYLTAVIDWHSRYVLSWRLSNSMETRFCVDALQEALDKYGNPEIFNTDQGAQFTSNAFTGLLEAQGVNISMDGKGRALDNIFVERLWRTVKYEEIYLKDYENGHEAFLELKRYFDFYNSRRPHQSLQYKTPEAVFYNRVDGMKRIA